MSRCQGNRGVSFQKCQIALLSSHFSDNPVSLPLLPSPTLTPLLPRGNHGLCFIPCPASTTLPMQGPLRALLAGPCCVIFRGDEKVCVDGAGVEREMLPSSPPCFIPRLGTTVPGCHGAIQGYSLPSEK